MRGKLDIHPKVAGGTVAGSAAILIIWILSLVHVAVPDLAAGALVVVLTGIGGWLSPPGYPETPAGTASSASPSTK